MASSASWNIFYNYCLSFEKCCGNSIWLFFFRSIHLCRSCSMISIVSGKKNSAWTTSSFFYSKTLCSYERVWECKYVGFTIYRCNFSWRISFFGMYFYIYLLKHSFISLQLKICECLFLWIIPFQKNGFSLTINCFSSGSIPPHVVCSAFPAEKEGENFSRIKLVYKTCCMKTAASWSKANWQFEVLENLLGYTVFTVSCS